jgi:transketolase
VANLLESKGIAAAVVSMPCWELFEQQDDAYREYVLGPEDVLRVSIEAASTFGWERYVGRMGLMIGMTSFGASAPAPELYKHFGFTVEAIADKILRRIK